MGVFSGTVSAGPAVDFSDEADFDDDDLWEVPEDAASGPYAWLAGESATTRALRRHLVQDRGYPREAVSFTGYWRRGTTEDELLAAAVAEATA